MQPSELEFKSIINDHGVPQRGLWIVGTLYIHAEDVGNEVARLHERIGRLEAALRELHALPGVQIANNPEYRRGYNDARARVREVTRRALKPE